MNNQTTNILFCGTGGQGVLKAAEICGWAALYDGYHVKKSEVHGMAQRGGSVESHVRFGKEVFSPLAPKGAVDILVPFFTGERDRLQDFLKEGGADLLSELIPGARAVPHARFINTWMLGRLSCHLKISEASWLKAIDTVFAGKHTDANKEVFLKARKQ